MISIARPFRSAAGAIVLILMLRSVTFGVLGLILPLYFDSIGRSAGEWGMASGAFALAMTFSEPAWGWASDQLGAALPFLVAGLGSAFLVPLFALTSHPWALAALQFTRGSVEFASSPAARKALAHSLGPGRKAVGIGLFQACSSAGAALGPLLGSLVLGRWGYPAAFLLCSVSSLTAVGVTLANRHRLAATTGHSSRPDPSLAAQPPESLEPGNGSTCAFLAMALIAACLFAATFAGRSFMPLLGTNVLGLPAAQVAMVLSITGALGGPLTILMGSLSDRWGRKPLIIGGLLCSGAGLLGYASLSGLGGLAVCTFLLTLGFAAAVPAGVALVADNTPFSRQGRMIGLYGASENAGIVAGPMLCGFLWDAQGHRAAFVACALFAALGIAAALAVRETE
jgi:MFS family permease